MLRSLINSRFAIITANHTVYTTATNSIKVIVDGSTLTLAEKYAFLNKSSNTIDTKMSDIQILDNAHNYVPNPLLLANTEPSAFTVQSSTT